MNQGRLGLREIAVSYPARLTVYGMICFVVFQIVMEMVRSGGPGWVGAENGPLEMSQVVLASLAAAGFGYAAWRSVAGRAGLTACAVMVAYAAAREADSLFESWFFEDAYKYLVGLPALVLGLAVAWRHRDSVLSDSLWLVRQPAVTMFAIAGIYLCAMTQILDRPDLWSGIEASSASAKEGLFATKGMVEESAELFAYLVLAFSGGEAVVLAGLLTRDDQADESSGEMKVQTMHDEYPDRRAA